MVVSLLAGRTARPAASPAAQPRPGRTASDRLPTTDRPRRPHRPGHHLGGPRLASLEASVVHHQTARHVLQLPLIAALKYELDEDVRTHDRDLINYFQSSSRFDEEDR